MENLLQDYLTKQEASKWLHNLNDYESISITTISPSVIHNRRNDLQTN